ncbi:hypothetical protein PV325_001402 [Microctonus aethiopoides]|uniref:Essential protein Yae1 N-terminal domain-containing protein n=1 Tax=Microctonus aethiopoides TaxID=144406 RepID=A0AA39F8A1_9HYME|nr:hypothetical protein PV325_001402 [Microctonus aethiopoides]KAK0098561.1 hypothetical protein PV326_006788 [Microctonus aethiopoides]KAK0164790.1 hypothetical protein PV328_003366 [Microctonus aethiopoides]
MDNILDNDDDTLNIGSKTWNRLMDGMSKTGFREGVEEGSQAILQADFDKGYVDGFKTAFILGKYKSLAIFELNEIEHPKEINDILEKTQRGVCHICDLESSNENLRGDSEIIINNHQKHVSTVLNKLYSYFSPLLKDRGIDISNLKHE